MIDPRELTTRITNQIDSAFAQMAATWPAEAKQDIHTAATRLTTAIAVSPRDDDAIMRAACGEMLAATHDHPEAGRIIAEARDSALESLVNTWLALIKDDALSDSGSGEARCGDRSEEGTLDYEEIHRQLHAEVAEINRTTTWLVQHDDPLGRESLTANAAWIATLAALHKTIDEGEHRDYPSKP